MAEKKKGDLPGYLDELVDRLRKLVPAALKGRDVEAVHDARVATRRLKAAVDLVAAFVSDRSRRPFARASRDLRRQLGPLRDLDVMLEHLDEIKIARYAAAVQWLQNRLSERRKQVLEEASEQIPPARILAKLGSWWGLRQEIAQSEDKLPALLAQSIHLQLDAFAEQADQLVASRAAPAGIPPVKNDPHQLRIAGKLLRYTLEMARQQGRLLPSDALRLFKKLQEALGTWHDFIVLTERILRETVDCDLALHQPALQGTILDLAQLMLKRAQHQLGHVAVIWSQKGQDLVRRIRESFPLTASPEGVKAAAKPVTLPKTGLDPAGSSARAGSELPTPGAASIA